MTTTEILQRFQVEYLTPRSITPRRQAYQLRELHQLAASLDHPLIELTQSDVLTYLGVLLGRGLSPNTVRWVDGMIRSFVTWGNAAGLIDDLRAHSIKLISRPRGSTGDSTPNPYTMKEIKTFRGLLAVKYPYMPEYGRGSRMLHRYLTGRVEILRGAAYRHARRVQFDAQIALTMELGLRSIEMYRLSIPAAHYENDSLVVETAKGGPGKPKIRMIPWTPHAHNCMMSWLDLRSVLAPQHPSLWLALDYTNSSDRHQLCPMTERQLHNALSVFGTGWGWHRFRHTCATEWLRAKMPLEKVQILMGHSSIEQTRQYTQIVHSDIAEAIATAGPEFARRMGVA